MAEYTGKGMTLSVAGGTALEGILSVNIDDAPGPAIAQLPATAATDSTYVTIAQPLGSAGRAKATMTVKLQDSTVSYADSKAALLAFNTPGVVAFAAGVVANDDKWDHTTLELLDRTTTITWEKPIATIDLTFGADGNGTWGSVT